MKYRFLVGTYTEPGYLKPGPVPRRGGEGLYACEAEDGELRILGCAPLINPSFFCTDEGRRRIYAVSETHSFRGGFGGSVSEIAYDRDLNMEIRNTLETEGADPCHAELSPDGSVLAVSNYSGGSLTVYRVAEDGSLTGEKKVFRHEGRGVNPQRQEKPHVHSTVFLTENFLLAADLGTDQLAAYRLRGGEVLPSPEENLRIPAGNGPRCGELSADGRHFYLITEMGGRILHYQADRDRLTLRGAVSSLPEDFRGENTAADVHLTPDGRYLYASNRGHDSLAQFAVGPDGDLISLGWVSCGGKTPRQFRIDPAGQFLLVANQDSDSIVRFSVGPDGRLTMERSWDFPSPVCVRFLRTET